MTENIYNPSAFENNDGWTGPEYAYSSNNLYASTEGKGDNVTYRDYGIAQVPGEDPSKVEVGIEARGDGDDYVEVQASWDGGVTWTSLVGHVPPTTDPDVPTYLDVTNGRTWTWDELSNADFRVRIYKRTTGKGAAIDLDWIPVRITSMVGAVETIVAQKFPMRYLEKPVKAQELTSTVEGATVTHVAKTFPEALLKTGKAKELRSRF